MLLWIEGFDSFGTTLNGVPSPTSCVLRKYPVCGDNSKFNIEEGRFGGYALQLQWDNTAYFSPGSLTTNSTLIVGMACKWKSQWADNSYGMFLAFYDNTTLGMNLYMTTAGEISVRKGTTVVATTSGLGQSLGAWFYVEFKVVCGTTGSYELRINGQTVLSNGSYNTKQGTNNYHTTFRVTGTSVTDASAIVVDDLYCCDGSGSANNTFLGNQKVVTIRPDAAGDSAQFTPSAGSNYACVDEQVANDDTDYVESATNGDKDLHNYGSLSGLGTITGVQVSTECRETDATNFTLVTLTKSGGTEDPDAGKVIGSTTYVTKRRMLENDPATGSPWLASAVNSAQFGYQVG